MAVHALIHILAWQIGESIAHVLDDDFLLRQLIGLICDLAYRIQEH